MTDNNDEGKDAGSSSLALPFADAPTIVQAHQKDLQIESILTEKLTTLLTSLKGQLFTNTYPKEISIAVKLLYLTLTTFRGRRTLGEEYVDLIYVDRKGTGLVKRYRKLLFILSYTLGPYLITKVYNKLCAKIYANEEDENRKKISLKQVLSAIVETHLVLFYFKGAYYEISKRLFGLRYSIGHEPSANEAQTREQSTNTYKLLGNIMLLQQTAEVLPICKGWFKSYYSKDEKGTLTNEKQSQGDIQAGILTRIPNESEVNHLNLSDKEIFPFIPEDARKCILCLAYMTDPSCSPCGHIFCWECILDWCKERPECPLCRQECQIQQILPLR
ncbi:hypothetical protein NCAS_0C05290 [Naumovozyma castellii]|uniref:RING-type E3 ubiquitin transferase n=1 Tax=Naumovozyma castellii TaxID=27288 RepID=G0VDF7_NAUCA|nr:hypothetical protein NCAS_0C05290 [Naumovozyma castellii CBS 4309]CCC69519.1 hypothetical protein NCAS_0C05290 [Naumovozyma castellii CBS 4309]